MPDFIIFGGDKWDPNGGMGDLVHRLDGTLDDAVAWLRMNTVETYENGKTSDYPRFDWFEIVNKRTLKTVLHGSTHVRSGQGVVCPPDEEFKPGGGGTFVVCSGGVVEGK